MRCRDASAAYGVQKYEKRMGRYTALSFLGMCKSKRRRSKKERHKALLHKRHKTLPNKKL